MSLLLASLALPVAAESRFGLGLDLLFEHQESLEVSAFRGTILTRDLLNGGEQSAEQPGDPALLNRKFDLVWELEGTGVELPIELPGRWGLDPKIVLQAGVADVSLDFIGLRDRRDDAVLSGRGPLFGAELEVEGSLFGGSPLSWSGTLRWQQLPSLTVDRSPAFRPEGFEVTADGVELSQQGFEVMGDEVRLSQEVQELTARVGYSVASGRTKTYLGIRHRRTNLTIEDELGYVDPLGEIETRLASRTELKSGVTLAVAGVESSLGDRLHGRVETAVGAGDLIVVGRVVYLWPREGRQEEGETDDVEQERRARAIADALAPRLGTIKAEFLAERRGLTLAEGREGDSVYLAREVDALLTRTEEKLLAALDAFPELEALMDWVRDQFDAAWKELASAHTTALTAPIPAQVTHAALALRPAALQTSQPASEAYNRRGGDAALDLTQAAIDDPQQRSKNKKLLTTLRVRIELPGMTRLEIWPRNKSNQPHAYISFNPDSSDEVYLGIYSFAVLQEGEKDALRSCNPKMGRRDPPCPLDLVKSLCRVVSCDKIKGCKSEACR